MNINDVLALMHHFPLAFQKFRVALNTLGQLLKRSLDSVYDSRDLTHV